MQPVAFADGVTVEAARIKDWRADVPEIGGPCAETRAARYPLRAVSPAGSVNAGTADQRARVRPVGASTMAGGT